MVSVVLYCIIAIGTGLITCHVLNTDGYTKTAKDYTIEIILWSALWPLLVLVLTYGLIYGNIKKELKHRHGSNCK